MNKALFTRKAVNIDELKRRTGAERDKAAFVVEKVIELSVDSFKAFCSDLLNDYDFIKENADIMYVDTDRVWHCLLVKAEGGKDGVLVEAEAYDYCRYGSYISDCSGLVENTGSPLTERIKQQILEIRAEGKYNMLDTVGVQREAHNKGFHELVIFLEEHKKEYAGYILTGQ